jgi:hypothetical protein
MSERAARAEARSIRQERENTLALEEKGSTDSPRAGSAPSRDALKFNGKEVRKGLRADVNRYILTLEEDMVAHSRRTGEVWVSE